MLHNRTNFDLRSYVYFLSLFFMGVYAIFNACLLEWTWSIVYVVVIMPEDDSRSRGNSPTRFLVKFASNHTF